MIVVAQDSQFAQTIIDKLGGVAALNTDKVPVVLAAPKRTLAKWKVVFKEYTVLCAAALTADTKTVVNVAYHIQPNNGRPFGANIKLTKVAQCDVDATATMRRMAIDTLTYETVGTLMHAGGIARIAKRIFRKGDSLVQTEDARYILPEAQGDKSVRYMGMYLRRTSPKSPGEWMLIDVGISAADKRRVYYKVKPGDVENVTPINTFNEVVFGVEDMIHTFGVQSASARPIPLTALLKAHVIYQNRRPVQLGFTGTPPATEKSNGKSKNTGTSNVTPTSGATADTSTSGATAQHERTGNDEADAPGRLLPRYRIGQGYLYDTYDIKRFQDRYLNPRLVTIAQIAAMTGLSRYAIHRKMYDVRDNIAVTRGNKDRRIGALYDLDNPVLQHLFALWGWTEKIKEKQQNDEGSYTIADVHTQDDAELQRKLIARQLKRRTRSEQGR